MTVGRSLWLERPVLVTGATGLVGGWLVEALCAREARVVCMVRDWVPSSRFVAERIQDRVETVRGDVSDQANTERILSEYEIRTVFHLAAQTIVPIANRSPACTFETNIKGAWAMLEACRRSPLINAVVLASSDKVYGDAQSRLPYREDAPLEGRGPYDVSKACADLIAQSYARSFNLPVCATRCSNIFGGGDLNWSRLIPGVMRDLIWGRSPTIRSDGSHVRDYLYVEDAVSAYLRTAEALMENPHLGGRAYNFSLQKPLTVLEMLSKIAIAVGTHVQPSVLGETPNEILEQHLDSTRARTELGWRPTTGLEEGLRRTAGWYRGYLTKGL
jgi:CDP-glucose 4,6-dehydratase